MATPTPIFEAFLKFDPFTMGAMAAGIILLAAVISLAYKPQSQRQQEAEAQRARLMAKAGLKPDHFYAPPPAIPRRAGFVELLLQWKYLLEIANKPSSLPIFVPDEGWEEFAKALRKILPEHLEELLIDDLSIEKGEIKILGFKIVRLNHVSQLTKPRYYPLPGDERAARLEEILKEAHNRSTITWIPKRQTKARPSRSPKPKPRSQPKPRRKSPKKVSKRR